MSHAHLILEEAWGTNLKEKKLISIKNIKKYPNTELSGNFLLTNSHNSE